MTVGDEVLSVHAQIHLLAEDWLVSSMTQEASHVIHTHTHNGLKRKNKAKCLGDKMIWAYAVRWGTYGYILLERI